MENNILINIDELNKNSLFIIEENSNIQINVNKDCSGVINFVVKNSINMKINLDENSNLEINNLICSSNNLENEIIAELNGENALLNLNTLDYINEKNVHKNNIVINHNNVSTEGIMKNNLIAKNGGKIDLDGISKIHKGQRLSNARQSNRGVLLDNLSSIKAIPCLLIDEYDCKASHGAAIGKISDDGLFYLMSRGLTKHDAMNLIISGFIKPFVEKINDENIQNQLFDFYNN